MNIKWAQHVQELLKRGRPEDLVQSLEASREQKPLSCARFLGAISCGEPHSD